MFPRVTHPSATASEETVRLACVKPAASVRSEPGSNSQVEPKVIDPAYLVTLKVNAHRCASLDREPIIQNPKAPKIGFSKRVRRKTLASPTAPERTVRKISAAHVSLSSVCTCQRTEARKLQTKTNNTKRQQSRPEERSRHPTVSGDGDD